MHRNLLSRAPTHTPTNSTTPPGQSPVTYKEGSGVIWRGVRFETPVIPAKAGIQSVDSASPKVCGVDSRFRGNDCDFQRPGLANDTTTIRGADRFLRV